ncbi:MAG: zf-HC2 domain-containing protein [Myxococcales bacterium]|nr:zf-HC2 domain-containing protein [Myxococcales bacterium]
MEGEIIIGGLRCSDVLAVLGDALDGSLDPARASAVQVHLAGCDRCARFGGAVAAMIDRLRQRAGQSAPQTDAPEADAIAARLDARLAREP